MTAQRFRTAIEMLGKSHAVLPVPFDPAGPWGERDRYLVRGTIGGCNIRGSLEERAGGWVLPIGPAWRRDSGIAPGTPARFWDALATFYRKAYLRWIEATKRSPETRALRIAETVRLLKAGRKERPR